MTQEPTYDPKNEPCQKCGKKACEPHECPYASEINDDHTPCNCCEECQHECMMEI